MMFKRELWVCWLAATCLIWLGCGEESATDVHERSRAPRRSTLQAPSPNLVGGFSPTSVHPTTVYPTTVPFWMSIPTAIPLPSAPNLPTALVILDVASQHDQLVEYLGERNAQTTVNWLRPDLETPMMSVVEKSDFEEYRILTQISDNKRDMSRVFTVSRSLVRPPMGVEPSYFSYPAVIKYRSTCDQMGPSIIKPTQASDYILKNYAFLFILSYTDISVPPITMSPSSVIKSTDVCTRGLSFFSSVCAGWSVSFLVMERFGESLRERLNRDGLLERAAALALGREIARKVIHLHSLRISHGDISTGNILVTPESEVRLIDFDNAEFVDRQTRVSPDSLLRDDLEAIRKLIISMMKNPAEKDKKKLEEIFKDSKSLVERIDAIVSPPIWYWWF
jgi:hypothetical protein